jgi:predicted amidohydrolase YtcJ
LAARRVTVFAIFSVLVVHVSMHGAVLNSAAFQRFGYKDGIPTPEGGIIALKPALRPWMA